MRNLTRAQISELRSRAGRYAGAWCQSHPADREDFIQEAVVKAIEGQYRTPVVPTSVIWNLMSDLNSSRRTRARFSFQIDRAVECLSIDISDQIHERLEMEAQFRLIFETATPEEQTLLCLYIEHGFSQGSHGVIAQMLGTTSTAIKTRLYRVLKRIRAELAPQATSHKPQATSGPLNTPTLQHSNTSLEAAA